MNGKACLFLIGGALAASVASAAPAHAADRLIASSPSFVSPVQAYGGNVVWGQAAIGVSGFAYLVRDAKGTRQIPALRGSVRHIDLGARRGGGAQAVFVRCPPPRRACGLRTYDFRSGRTDSLTSLSRLPGTVGIPSVWNSQSVFTRSLAGRNLGLFAMPPLRAVTRAKTLSTDLRGSRVAYLTSAPNGPPGTVPQTTTLRVASLPRGRGRVRSCFIARARGTPRSDRVQLSNVALTATHVLWLRRDLGRPGPNPGTIRRRRLPARGCPSGGGEEHSREILRLQSFAVDRGRFFYTTNNKVWEATDPPLSFAR